MDERRVQVMRTKLEKMTPNSFLCKYPLKTGSKIIAVFFALIQVIILIVTIIQAVQLSRYRNTDRNDSGYSFPIRNSFGYTIVACFYSAGLVVVHIWFYWGIAKEKSSVVLSWCVIMAVWMIQFFLLVVVLIGLYSADTSLIPWIICLLLGLLVVGIFAYCVFIGFGYYAELRAKRSAT